MGDGWLILGFILFVMASVAGLSLLLAVLRRRGGGPPPEPDRSRPLDDSEIPTRGRVLGQQIHKN